MQKSPVSPASGVGCFAAWLAVWPGCLAVWLWGHGSGFQCRISQRSRSRFRSRSPRRCTVMRKMCRARLAWGLRPFSSRSYAAESSWNTLLQNKEIKKSTFNFLSAFSITFFQLILLLSFRSVSEGGLQKNAQEALAPFCADVRPELARRTLTSLLTARAPKSKLCLKNILTGLHFTFW